MAGLPSFLKELKWFHLAGETFPRGQYPALLLRLLLLLGLFSLSRLLFYFFNLSAFSTLSGVSLLKVFLAGIRFDLSAILLLNAPFILLFILPFRFTKAKTAQQTGRIYFFVINGIALFFNAADMVYFRFANTRTDAGIFRYLGTGDDFLTLLPAYIRDYWVVLLIMAAMMWSMIKIYNRLQPRFKDLQTGSFTAYFFSHLPWFIILGALTVTGMRGGLQMRPITIVTAGNYAGAKYSPLVVNTPFKIIKTYGKQGVEPVAYFEDQETLAKWFQPEKLYSLRHRESVPKNRNVVIIILEGFTNEYSARLSPQYFTDGQESFTPFLDSLMGKSLVFEHSFANATRSVEAIPAIIASIPHLMNRSFILSGYVGNTFHSLPHELKTKSYISKFFHGGTNGTMGFDAFAGMAGFDTYHGRNEYNNDEHYDGRWGIFDEEFLQYTARVLNNSPQPFSATVLTLSSHHPYTIPEKYHGVFPEGPLPIHRSVRYADHSLERFFGTAAQMPWYENTLFVITSDHSSQIQHAQSQTRKAIYEVPLFFYVPGKRWEIQNLNEPVQHVDIMPSVLDYLGYDRDFISFGSSVFDDQNPRFAFHYLDGIYQVICSEYLLLFDGSQATGLFNHQRDPWVGHNLLEVKPEVAEALTRRLKARIQEYNNRMLTNSLTIE